MRTAFRPAFDIVFAAVFSLSAAGVWAADPPATSKLGTRDHLRTCMNSEDALLLRRKALEADLEANQKDQALLQADTTALIAEQQSLAKPDQKPDQKAIDAFNAHAAKHNEQVNDTNAKATAFNAAKSGFNDDTLAYNKECSGVVYNTDDRDAVLKERKAKTP